MTFRLPFVTPQKKPQAWATPDGTQQTNVNVFTNPIPFAQTDWAPVKPFPRVPQQTVTFNNLLFIATVAAAPFAQNSFPPVVKPPVSAPAQAVYNPALYANPVPFAQYDWSKGFRIPGLPPQAIPYNYNLFPPPAAIAPFLPIDYSKPFFPLVRIDATRQLNPNLFTNPVPFAQYDWSKPVRLQGALYPAPQPYSQSLFTNPIPFSQLDWSKPQAVSDWQPAISWQPSLSLTTAPIASPFIPVDYNRSFRVPGLPPGSGPLNLNLFKNAIPFGPFDWSKPVRLQGALYAAPQPYNHKLYTNPIPFAQFDWSKPVRLPGVPAAPIPLNGNLYVSIATDFATLSVTENIDTASFALSFSRWAASGIQSEVWATSIKQAETWTPATIQSETWTEE